MDTITREQAQAITRRAARLRGFTDLELIMLALCELVSVNDDIPPGISLALTIELTRRVNAAHPPALDDLPRPEGEGAIQSL